MRRQLLKSVLLVLALSLGLLACGSNEGDEATTRTSAETTTTTAPGDTATGTGNRDLDTYCQSVAELDAEFTATGTVDPEAYDGLLVASEAIAEDPTIQGDADLAAAAEACLATFSEIPADSGAGSADVSPEARASALCAEAEDLVAQFEQVATVDDYLALEDEATALSEAGATLVAESPDQQTTIENCNDAMRSAADQAASQFPVDTPTD